MRLINVFLLFSVLLAGFTARAEFQVPPLTGPVMDEAGYLERQDRQDLMQLLYDFNRRGVAQVQVLIIDSLQGEPIEQASIKITDRWKLGDSKKDNGVLFLISAQDRQMRIEVGQGLEGAIPDAIAKRIISEQVIPLFRARQFSAGVVVGTHEILRYADKEFADQNNIVPQEENKKSGSIPVGVLILLFIIIIVLGRFGGGGGRRFRGGSGWGGGGFGGGGWSGGGGGGWSGGGGGFSGGGASGSW